MNKLGLLLIVIFSACKSSDEKIKPHYESISESVYASGIVKSNNQYEVFSTVNGIIKEIFVKEGDSVKKGSPLLSISSETQKLSKENAALAAQFSDFHSNQNKLTEAELVVTLSGNKMKNDSALYFRQKTLWDQQVGSKVDLEQRQLAYENSKTAYFSAIVKRDDLKRQLEFTSSQAKKNLLISNKLESDFTLRSEIDGKVYSLNKYAGELVSPQTPVAVIGDAVNFILEMQVDEYDILKIKPGLQVLITMDSYKGKVFEARVTKIYPFMKDRSKTFLVEAVFVQAPPTLYPNVTFEANIVLQSKDKAMLIPRNYLVNDSLVTKANGDKVVVSTGLKDYRYVEILSGLSAGDEIIKPRE